MSLSSYLELPGFLPFYPLFVGGALLLAYLCGAIPMALIIGRLTSGVDIREHGSGNTGTTNAFRVLGWGPGLLVFAGDVLKGSLGCLIMHLTLAKMGSILLESTDLLIDKTLDGATAAHAVAVAGPLHDIPLALALLVCIVGHMFSVFMKFKGGKGIATSFGALLVVMPFVALSGLAVFLLFTFVSRIASVGSITAALSLPITAFIFHGDSVSYIVFTFIAAFIMIIAHRKNVVRIFQGKEPRFSIANSKENID